METRALGSGIAVALVVTAGACGKSEEVELATFGVQASRTICDKVYECCMPMEAQLAMHMTYGGGPEACGNKSESAMGFWAAVIEKEQQRGRLTYDGKAARRCLDAFAATSCEGHKLVDVLAACESFITPRTPPGSPCNANESCVGGACVGQTAEKEGVCRAHAVEGGSCADVPCGQGLFCEGGKLCRRKRADGEACQTHGECRSQGCNGRDPEGKTPGTCGLKGGEQTRCFVTTGCAFGGGPRGGGGLATLLGLAALAAGVARRRRRAARLS